MTVKKWYVYLLVQISFWNPMSPNNSFYNICLSVRVVNVWICTSLDEPIFMEFRM